MKREWQFFVLSLQFFCKSRTILNLETCSKILPPRKKSQESNQHLGASLSLDFVIVPQLKGRLEGKVGCTSIFKSCFLPQ